MLRHRVFILCAASLFSFQNVVAQSTIDSRVTPFFSSNQSPVIQIHNLPAVDSAFILNKSRTRYRLVNDLASNYTFRNTSSEDLLFDGETNRTTFIYSRGMGNAWEWGVQVPYVNVEGGSLDSFIEDWHDTFGLPKGGRNIAPRNRLNFFYQRNGVTQLSLTQASAGIGDVRLTAGWQLPNVGKDMRVAIRGSLSLPTGDSKQLRGSGAPEAALWASADRSESWFAFPGSSYAGGGLLLMGKGDVLSDQQRRVVAFGSVGAGARVSSRVTLKLQADANSSFYNNSSLVQINATAVQLLMGGDLQLGKNTRLDIMVGEDIAVHAAPDVVFHLGLTVQ